MTNNIQEDNHLCSCSQPLWPVPAFSEPLWPALAFSTLALSERSPFILVNYLPQTLFDRRSEVGVAVGAKIVTDLAF